MLHLDRIVTAAVLSLGLAVSIVSVASARLGASIDSVTTGGSMDGVSVNTRIAVTFTEPMDARSVRRHLHIAPPVPGDILWSGNELFFTPRQPLAYNTTYTMRIDAAARSVSGKPLARGLTYTFRTQSPHLLYLGTTGSDRGRLVLAATTGKREVVGSDDGLITDFAVSIDRSLAVYTKRSSSGSRPDEIWLLSLADNTVQRVFAHPGWTISQPHLSPQDNSVVFLATNVRLCAKYYGCFVDRSSPVVYLLDLGTHRLRRFSAGSSVPITSFIDFSPSGQIAYTDLGSALTLANPNARSVQHIPNLGNSLEFVGFDGTGSRAAFVGQTASSTGGDVLVYVHGKYLDVSQGIYDSSTPSLSSSGREIAYAAYRGEKGIEPVYGINAYDFHSRRTRHLTGERTQSDWAPVWSSDGRYIAFIRSVPQEAMYMGAGQVWTVYADGTDARPVGGIGANAQWVS